MSYKDVISSKKGQVTAFFVIGIIIAALLFIGIYYRGFIMEKLGEKEIAKSNVQAEIASIKENIADCMNVLADDASNQLGMHGGYISLPENEIPINLANPMPNRITVLPGLETAYWFYDEGNNVQRLNIPTVMSMENEIAKYIDENMVKCTGDFSEFTGEISYKRPKTRVEIKEKSIIVSMKWPIELVRNETSYDLDDFSVSLAKPLGELYNDAKQIMDAEAKTNFLEEKTLDMFVVYDEIPYEGVDFECNPRTWSKLEAMRNIKNIVSNNIQYMKVKGTNYGFSDEDNKYFEVDALRRDDENLAVNFMFSMNWPMLVDVIPDDAILKGESFTSTSAGKYLAQLFCLNYYHFVYNVKYPVLISLNKEGYTFQFGTQVIINNNQPKQSKVDVNYMEGSQARLCEYPMTNVRVNVMGFDADGTLRPLSNAEISFKCLGATCDIGEGNKELAFPQCLNGRAIAERDGYNKNSAVISTNEEQEVTINLEPIYEKDLSVVVTRDDGGDRGLLSSELAMLQFEDNEQGYYAGAFYPYSKKIKLIAGDYNVKVILISNLTSPLQLKEQKVKSCIKMPKKGLLGIVGITEKKCSEATIPGMALSQAISGGEEFEWSVNREELADAKGLIVYAIGNKLPTTMEELQKTNEKIAKNADNTNFKVPVLK